MSLNDVSKDVYLKVKPYERYIIAFAVVYCLDYFVLNGKFRKKINKWFNQIGDRLVGVVDAGINKLCGVTDGALPEENTKPD